MKKLLFVILLIPFISISQNKVVNNSLEDNFKTWAEKPPMGWNSYNCFGAAVTEKEVKANADYMSDKLKDHGWEYVVIDYCWSYPHPPGNWPDADMLQLGWISRRGPHGPERESRLTEDEQLTHMFLWQTEKYRSS